ncbi:hypothetical protein CALCODRAFT_479326 [Calocera cornea HHB12733]|uniref:Autophagy-related protein 14 n=1 Tax=Calocera cornea HHB12733 TaxID=1353952 RepID=A0A165JQ50_9BASI|nr:hypothetical protein CALCODRAFT_479326 [Calocera cornea HHB12733]
MLKPRRPSTNTRAAHPAPAPAHTALPQAHAPPPATHPPAATARKDAEPRPQPGGSAAVSGKGRASGAAPAAAAAPSSSAAASASTSTSARGAPESSNTPGRRSLHTMECATCERSQRRFFCANCVSNYIRDFRLAQSRVEVDRQKLQEGVKQLLDLLEPRRREKATRTMLVDRTREIRREVERLKKKGDELREKVRARRDDLQRRRQGLSRAQQVVSSPLTFTPLTAAQSRLDTLSDRLALARRGLALLLMEVFDLRQSASGEATIVGLPFPRPGDHRHVKPEQINGVLVHTLHFLHLLAYYLGVKLPFAVSWSGGRFLVGKPTIRAGSGNAEDGDWVRWTVKQPLYVSPADSARYSGAGGMPSSFTTALSMLGYNVLYLLHTQGLRVPVPGKEHLPPRVLNELIRLCISDSLGKRSHATRPTLPPPTHGFGLAFAGVLEAAKEADGSKRAEEMRRVEEGDADWDIVEDSG